MYEFTRQVLQFLDLVSFSWESRSPSLSLCLACSFRLHGGVSIRTRVYLDPGWWMGTARISRPSWRVLYHVSLSPLSISLLNLVHVRVCITSSSIVPLPHARSLRSFLCSIHRSAFPSVTLVGASPSVSHDRRRVADSLPQDLDPTDTPRGFGSPLNHRDRADFLQILH